MKTIITLLIGLISLTLAVCPNTTIPALTYSASFWVRVALGAAAVCFLIAAYGSSRA